MATSSRRQRAGAASSVQWGRSLLRTGASWWTSKMSSTRREIYHRRQHTRWSIISSQWGGQLPAFTAWIHRSTKRRTLPSPSWRSRASFADPTAAGCRIFISCARWIAAGSPAEMLGSSTSSQNRTSTPFPGWMTWRAASKAATSSRS